MKKKIIIIGGGIGGLATAALLGKSGHDVTVIEKNNQVGGRARVYKEKEFAFDIGPSWYMMPDAFEKFYAQFDKKPCDYFTLKKLSPSYKVFFSPDTSYEVSDVLKNNIDLFESIEAGAGKELEKFLKDSEKVYNLSMNELVQLDYKNMLDYKLLKVIKYLPSMNLFESYHSFIEKRFKDKRLQKILEFTTVFLGGSPYNMPAFYRLIAHTDFNLHIWYPMGGMYKVVESLKTLCAEHDVIIKTNESVQSVDVVNKVADLVITDKEQYHADIVISNADYAFTETRLLTQKDQTYNQNYWNKKTYAPSAFLIFLGLKEKIKNVEHHTLYFDPSWEQHFDTVFANSQWPESPSYYIHVPSKSDPSVAPEGGESLIFLVPVSAHLTDNDEIREKFSQQIIQHFEKLTGQIISDKIVVKKIYSQRDFNADYNTQSGSAFGLAHTLTQTAFFRPNNKSKKVKNLYYVGQYTNPGIGVPTCLISAQIVHSMITHGK